MPQWQDWRVHLARQQRVQRSGWRELYARADYAPRYTERWSLSLNHE